MRPCDGTTTLFSDALEPSRHPADTSFLPARAIVGFSHRRQNLPVSAQRRQSRLVGIVSVPFLDRCRLAPWVPRDKTQPRVEIERPLVSQQNLLMEALIISLPVTA